MFASRMTLVAVVALAAVFGCSKKVTKLQETPKDTPRLVQEPASPDDAFRTADMDAELRALLVPVHFEYNRSDLRPEAITSLERIGRFLQQNPPVRVLVEGHCDERGSSEYNMGLGENRSRSIKNWLISYGIDASRIEITSYGKERPASAFCRDEQCHYLNRRAEWKVLQGPAPMAFAGY